MIELAKGVVEDLLGQIKNVSSTFSGLTDSQIINGLIIVKYHLVADTDNIIINNYITTDNPVFLYKADTFLTHSLLLCDYIQNGTVPSNTGFSVTSNTLHFTPDSTIYPSTGGFCDVFIVYFQDTPLGNNHPVFDFTGTNISMISFIGNDYHELNFGGNCPYLEEINLSNNNDSLDVKYGTYQNNSDLTPGIYNGNFQKITFANNAFAGSNVKQIVFPNSEATYTIPEGCFEGSTQLMEVIIPDSVTGIGKNAFRKCTNLEYVYIGRNVTTIEEGAFEECTYAGMEFETSYDNTKFLGEKFALLRKNTDKTYSVIHATDHWMSDWAGIYSGVACHHMVYRAADLPSYINPTTQHIGAGFINTNRTEVQFTDIHGTQFTGYMISTQQTTQSQLNGVRQDGTLIYAMPVFKLIKGFEPRACVNGHMEHLRFRIWDSLEYIGKEAFKGAVLKVQWPAKYGFNLDTTQEYDTRSFYIESYAQTFTIGESAFENCSLNTNNTTLYVNKKTIWGDKCFYGCQNLEGIDFRENTPSIDYLLWDNEGKINWDPAYTTTDLGKLSFANTPSLATITCSANPVNNTVKCNAIGYFSNSGGTWGYIMVGCKNTDFATLSQTHHVNGILENAFYGCTSLTLSNPGTAFDNYDLIGSSAFYACSNLLSTEATPIMFRGKIYRTSGGQFDYAGIVIGSKAFYGCTNIIYLHFNEGMHDPGMTGVIYATLGSKAFASTGINKIDIDNHAYVTLSNELDTFDGCSINTISVTSTNNDAYGVRWSNTDEGGANTVENVLWVGETSYTNNTTLVKSGTGKDIINVPNFGDDQGYILKKIKTKAFSGVSLNNGSNTTIHIPKTVDTVEANIFDGSKTDNLVAGDPTHPCDLKLDGEVYSRGITNCVCNTDTPNLSTGLLFYLGGKYFKKIVEDTVTNKAQGYHYYTVTLPATPKPCIKIFEGISSIVIGEVTYDNNNNVVVRLSNSINWDYTAQDTDPHVTAISGGVELILMYSHQQFDSAEEARYCYGGITPGTTWQGINVPNDVYRSAKTLSYDGYTNISEGAFSNCKWVNNVFSQKLLTTGGLFKGCTNLKTIKGCDVDSISNLSLNIFNGDIPASCFEGCSNFTGILPANGNAYLQYPIYFGRSSFKNCSEFTDHHMLYYGTTFNGYAFDGCTKLREINLHSVLGTLHSTAFDNCTPLTAKADSTCGYYFTGMDETSIVNNENKIVVGSLSSDISKAAGICEHAFYGMNSNLDYILSHVDDYTIGTEAFANSSIKSYRETDCHRTVISQKAFKNCQSLTRANLGENAVIGESTFEDCISLFQFTVDGKTDIPANAFKGCVALPTIKTEGGIGENAFNGCTSLTSIELSQTSTSTATIEPSAFIGCPLATITIPLNATGTRKYEYDTGIIGETKCVYDYDADGHLRVVFGIKSFDISKIGVKVIGQHAYNGRGVSGVITIPQSVTRIEDYAFANNPNITKVYMPSTIEYIGANAFAGCTGLVRVVLPDSCQYVGTNAFKGCPLTEGFNSNTLDARYYTSSPIQSVAISGGNSLIKSSMDLTNSQCFDGINANAFTGCNIQVIKLPKICAKIESQAFDSCNSLVELHFSPSQPITIAPAAFNACSYLGEIYLHTKVIPSLIDYGGNKSHFYGAGGSIHESHRHLHVNVGLQNDATFASSDFYDALVTLGKFNVIYDLTE